MALPPSLQEARRPAECAAHQQVSGDQGTGRHMVLTLSLELTFSLEVGPVTSGCLGLRSATFGRVG